MDNSSSLRIVNDHGWLNGFTNLFTAANASWWRTRRWLVQAVFWLIFLDGMLAIFLWRIPPEIISESASSLGSIKAMEAVPLNLLASALMVFTAFGGMGLSIAAIIAGQDAFIGERQSGTAAWVLSKPVSRLAFILSRLAASTIAMLVTGVVVPSVAAYIQLSIKTGSWWPIAGFAGAMGLAFLNMIFYLSLTYMLGSLFSSRGAVLGISLAIALIGPTVLRTMPVLRDLTPWSFFFNTSENAPAALALMMGQSLESVTPIICTALLSALFVVVSILRFQREEF